MPKMTGSRFLAETLHGYGVTHYFFMPVSVPEAMPEFDRFGITSIMAHSEKGASTLEQALSAERPAVIDVKTHIEGIAPPAWDG